MQKSGLEQKNHYEILEVSQNASQEIIKAAYKSLMQRYHPDRHPGDAGAAERSVKVAQAYELLSDINRRAAYDLELKQRSAGPRSLEVQARNIMAAAAAREEKSEEGRLWLWLLLAPAAVALWFILPSSQKSPVSTEPRQFTQSQADLQQNRAGVYTIPVGARTIPALFKDMRVSMVRSGAATPDACNVLSIQTIGIVAGGFDPDRFISFMEANKEYIEQKLAEKLATANCEMLVGLNGEQYLKRLILDSIGEITDTQTASPSGMERYGAVDVLLPDFYSVTSLQ